MRNVERVHIEISYFEMQILGSFLSSQSILNLILRDNIVVDN